MPTLRRARVPFESRSQRQRRRRRLIGRPIRRATSPAARRGWRGQHASNRLSSHQKSCNPWLSSSPHCARRRLTPE
jgi:hypothetical protein